jgi:hypothetical protein
MECLTFVSIPVCCGFTRILTAKSTDLARMKVCKSRPETYDTAETYLFTGTRMLSNRIAEGLISWSSVKQIQGGFNKNKCMAKAEIHEDTRRGSKIPLLSIYVRYHYIIFAFRTLVLTSTWVLLHGARLSCTGISDTVPGTCQLHQSTLCHNPSHLSSGLRILWGFPTHWHLGFWLRVSFDCQK